MSGEVRKINNELLVVPVDPAKLQSDVQTILNDPALSHLRLKEITSSTAPPGVAMLRSADVQYHDYQPGGTSSATVLQQVRDQQYQYVYPNYIIVHATHARVLPISYPRPAASRELPEAATSDVDVQVLVIDTALVAPSPINSLVQGAPKPLADATATPTAALHGTFVAGIIHMRAPGATVTVEPMQNTNDDAFISEWELACQLNEVANRVNVPDVVNLSLVVRRGFDLVEGGSSAADFCDDLFGGLVPDEGLGVVVPVFGPDLDGIDEVGHAGEHASA